MACRSIRVSGPWSQCRHARTTLRRLVNDVLTQKGDVFEDETKRPRPAVQLSPVMLRCAASERPFAAAAKSARAEFTHCGHSCRSPRALAPRCNREGHGQVGRRPVIRRIFHEGLRCALATVAESGSRTSAGGRDWPVAAFLWLIWYCNAASPERLFWLSEALLQTYLFAANNSVRQSFPHFAIVNVFFEVRSSPTSSCIPVSRSISGYRVFENSDEFLNYADLGRASLWPIHLFKVAFPNK